MGRQPWVVAPNPDGIPEIRLLTADAASPGVSSAAWSSPHSSGFALLYGVLLVVELFLLRALRDGRARGRHAAADPARTTTPTTRDGPDGDRCSRRPTIARPMSGLRVLTGTVMELTTFWFILIAVLWTGYFFLEGFDFGVGMLLHPLGRTETDRRVMINTIGPVWDGNEVWLITAGGATFAAFPNWYATLFSGFYLPLFLILIALIVRGVAFEYRGKVDDPTLAAPLGPRHRVRFVGAGCAVGCGVRQHRAPACRSTRTATSPARCFTLLNPFGLLGGAGDRIAVPPARRHFLALKPRGDIRERARRRPAGVAPVAVVAGGAFLIWNQIERGAGVDVGAGAWWPPAAWSWPRWPPAPTATAGRSPPRASRSPPRWSRCSARSSPTSCRPRPTRPSA